jgi:hypothetical protein
MDFLNKTYKNRVTGDTFTIIDVYQNIAITDKKEKINTSILANERLFAPLSNQNTSTMNEDRNYKVDSVDPNKFFNNQNIYNEFADKIKKIPLEDLPKESTITDNVNSSILKDINVSNESAIILSDPQDEIEELKRKYGATSIDENLKKQNEIFSRYFEDEQSQPTQPTQQKEESKFLKEQNMSTFENIEAPVHRIEVVDPIISMFKNVKRNIDFKIDFKVEGKIPRIDFIEMMEDSYDISIIDFLAQEFAEKLLNDPQILISKIKSEIKRLVESNSSKIVQSTSITKKDEENTSVKTQKRRRTTKKITTEND